MMALSLSSFADGGKPQPKKFKYVVTFTVKTFWNPEGPLGGDGDKCYRVTFNSSNMRITYQRISCGGQIDYLYPWGYDLVSNECQILKSATQEYLGANPTNCLMGEDN